MLKLMIISIMVKNFFSINWNFLVNQETIMIKFKSLDEFECHQAIMLLFQIFGITIETVDLYFVCSLRGKSFLGKKKKCEFAEWFLYHFLFFNFSNLDNIPEPDDLFLFGCIFALQSLNIYCINCIIYIFEGSLVFQASY